VALGDVDRDGKLDLVITRSVQPAVGVCLGDGAGGGGSPTDFTAGSGTYRAALGDVNRDGVLDAVTANMLSDNVSVLLGGSSPELHIAKTVSSASVIPGETLTYTLVFSNAGGSVAVGATLTDALPAEIEALGVASSGAVITQTSGAPAYAWAVANLAPDAGGVITLTGRVKDSALKGAITNTAYITANGVLTSSAAVFEVSCTREITVTNTNDAGPGSLRQAIADICPGGTIRFDVTTPATITLTSGELAITKTLTILGPGADQLTVSGGNENRVFIVEEDVSATIQDLTISNGSSSDAGGGVYSAGNLILQNCTLADNLASLMGGGVAVVSGTLAAEGVLIQGNTSYYGGGLIAAGAEISLTDVTFDGNEAYIRGGGLLLDAESTAMGQRVTFAHNVAHEPDDLPRGLMGGASGRGAGGGLQLEDGALRADFINSTWYGNQALGVNDDGGGAMNVNDGALTLLNCTIVSNTAASALTFAGFTSVNTDGGGINVYSGTVTLTNTLAAQNTSEAGYPDVAGAFTSGGHNLIGNATGATGFTHSVNGDIVGDSSAPVDPLVDSLGDWGGETETVPLLPGRPAIHKGDDAQAPADDQREVTRPQGAASDIGAYEMRPFTLSIAGGNNQSALLNTAFALPLSVTVSSAYTEPVVGGVVRFQAPLSGASAALSPITITIPVNGQVASAATANGQVGTYSVVASAIGASAPVTFTLTNEVHTPTPTNTSTPTSTPSAQYSSSVQFGPKELCPGYNLYYTLFINNTNLASALPNIVVTAPVPAGTWFFDEAGGMEYTYDGANVVWRLDSLPAGQTALAELTLHSSSALVDGTIITTTFQHQCGPLLERTDVVTSTVDSTACGSLPGPTATYEPTATHTPTPGVTLTLTATVVATPTYTPEPGPTILTYSFLPMVLK